MRRRGAILIVAAAAGAFAVARPDDGSVAHAQARKRTRMDDECREFRGLIHGSTRCVRVDLATGRVTPSAHRVSSQGASVLACDTARDIDGHAVTVKCAFGPRDAGSFDMRIELSVSIDGHPAVVVDRREGFWDFINIFARADRRTLDMTIDYGVLE
jgi:hypothetical protein